MKMVMRAIDWAILAAIVLNAILWLSVAVGAWGASRGAERQKADEEAKIKAFVDHVLRRAGDGGEPEL